MPLPVPTATIRTQVSVPLRFADGYATAARVFSFDGLVDGQENLAFGLGDRAAAASSVGRGSAPLVRLHSQCLTGDVFGSQRCDCGAQLLQALGVSRVALLSNNPDKAEQLRRFGVAVARQVPTGVHLSPANTRNLVTKARRGAHTLDLPLLAPATSRTR